jgi:methionyl-tRNA formyltransferase
LRPVPSAVKRLAAARGLPVYQPESLKQDEARDRIAAVKPDLLIVAAYGLILPQAVLDAARLGALNIHASLLPRWRGAAPIQRALLAGDAQTGVTIMRMDAGLDTGPMLAQQAIAIDAEDDAGSLHDRLAVLGARMIVEAIDALAEGRAREVPQPQTGVSYARKLERGDAQIDWHHAAADIARQVRALRPAPGAATQWRGQPLKVWRAVAAQGGGAAGQVLESGDGGIVISCGNGALRVTELQRAGGKRLPAAEFLRGCALAPGERLG